MRWEFLKMGAGSAQENMDTDAELLASVSGGRRPAVWRFYRWRQPAFSFGRSQVIEEMVDVEACHREGIELVQRPTGGGLVVHGWDFTYSVIAPADDSLLPRSVLASYERIHQWVVAALNELGIPAILAPNARVRGVPAICLSDVAPFDILLDEQKIAGGAQRRRRGYLLHQGYIALSRPPQAILTLAGTPMSTGFINAEGRSLQPEPLMDAIQHNVSRVAIDG